MQPIWVFPAQVQALPVGQVVVLTSGVQCNFPLGLPAKGLSAALRE